jgi:hypothetical protein
MSYSNVQKTTPPFFDCCENGNGELRAHVPQIPEPGAIKRGRPLFRTPRTPSAPMKAQPLPQTTADGRPATGAEQTQNAWVPPDPAGLSNYA